jgi:hypothetical protein
MARPTTLFALGILFVPALVCAQVGRDAAERRSDRRQIGTDRVQLAGDVADVRRLERLVGELDQARVSGNKGAEVAVQARIAQELRQETREGGRDLAQDKVEAAGARSEVRSDRREIRRDRAGAASPAQTRDDKRDLRDDRRDARDDARDAVASAQRAQKQQQIIAELRKIQPQVAANDANTKARQRSLLDEFLQVSKQDAKATGRELGEDRRELREDRRETREDVRRP